MSKNKKSKISTVRAHPRKVPVSKKNPTGITIVDQHPRRIRGTYLDAEGIKNTFKKYKKKDLVYPTAKRLKYRGADKYDKLIAVWMDYFNQKFDATPPIHPNVMKALIGTESSFDPDPPDRRIAIGLTQITKKTLKIMQVPNGEARKFTFKDIRQYPFLWLRVGYSGKERLQKVN